MRSSSAESSMPLRFRKRHTCSGSQVLQSSGSLGSGDLSAAWKWVFCGVLGLLSHRGRLGGWSESALCMATHSVRRSTVKNRGAQLSRRRTDSPTLAASPFSVASLLAFCAGALTAQPFGGKTAQPVQPPVLCASAMTSQRSCTEPWAFTAKLSREKRN